MNLDNGGLPDGWSRVTLADVVAPSGEKVEPGDWVAEPYLSLEHIESGTRRITARGTGADVNSTKARFRAGDVLYGKLRPYLNKVCRPDFDGICSTDILVFPSSGAVDNAFLLYWLSQPEVAEYASQNASGINLPRISFDKLSELILVLPPLAEQRRIAAKVEELQSRSRTAREALEAIPPLLEKFRQSVLAAAFRGDLTADWRARNPNVEPASVLLERIRAERRQKWEEAELEKMRVKGRVPEDNRWKQKYNEPEFVDPSGLPLLPDGWCWASAEECAWEITVGHVGPMQSRYVTSGIPFLRSQNVRRNRFDTRELQYIPADFHADLAKSRLTPGDLVIVRSGDPGTACVIPEELPEANCSDLVIARLLPGLLPELTAFYINSAAGKAHVRGSQVGVAQQHFNVGAMRRLAVPVIPDAEQLELLARLRSAEAVVDRIEREVECRIRDTNRLDRAILARAFRGELVPQDPNEEPASALVERIREERNAAFGKQTRRGTRRQSAASKA